MSALPKRVLQSLDFTVNRVLMKLFKSSNTVVIEQCRYFFHIELPSVQLQRRFEKFLVNAADDDKVYQYLMFLNVCLCSPLLIIKVIFVITVFFSFFYSMCFYHFGE